MGNLLGAPVTEKETHVGEIESAAGGGVTFGVSSMQGWRVHMEDAHICEPRLYAALDDGGEELTGADTKQKTEESGASMEMASPARTEENGSKKKKQKKISKLHLPGHSLFAVFDGHGGTFAANYAGRNLCRILSRQPKFVEYAKWSSERTSDPQSNSSEQEKVQDSRKGLELLECALRDCFVECDKEIIMAIRGTPHPDANTPYHDDDQPVASSTTDESDPTKNSGGDQSLPSAENDGNENAATSIMDAVTMAAQEAAKEHVNALDDEGDSGTTACVVVLTPDWIVCANAGDSRSVCSKHGNKAVPLSYDHKPDDEEEERRIRAAGGYVAGGRVEGDLAVSRGLGDFRFKSLATVSAGAHSNTTSSTGDNQDENSGRVTMAPGDQKVSSIPDIVVQNRNPKHDEFIIVACDGIWDVQSNHDCVSTVNTMFQEGESNMGLVCEEVRNYFTWIQHCCNQFTLLFYGRLPNLCWTLF